MAYLHPSTVTRIRAKLARKETQLEAAYTAYEAALASADTESYVFDSKEGKQATTLRSPTVIQSQISALEQEIERLYGRLNGTGLVTLNLRRNP